MGNEINSIEEAISSTKLVEHYCQYKILLRECAELLADIHTEFGELYFSIYQDDEIDDGDLEYHEGFQERWNEGLAMIERLKALKILVSPRKSMSPLL
ncbi:hypothetical protein [Undibacterium sp.]|uniref:hypothetical protein n=1 Tax=Undibacterium sp. TaxID=1914977 RepID=UPI00375036BF